MGLQAKSFLLLLVFLLSSAALALGDRREEGRELQRCKQECQERARYDAGQRRRCEVRCEEQKRRREEEQGRRERGDEHNRRDPRERLEECLQECRQQEQEPGKEQQRWKCERRCHEQYKREEQKQEGGRGNPVREKEQEEEREREREGEKKTGSRSPYFFQEEHFQRALSTEHGRIWLLKKFHEQSELLLGIANYRIAVFEMKPNTFELPVHCDADTILYVASGKGSIGILREEEQQQETHDIKHGDILRVRPGNIVYMANTDSNEKLYVIKLVKPIAVPTEVEAFLDVGGSPDSYLRSFSKEVLEAAYNTESEEVERLFRKRKEGFIKVSEEKMREMTRRRHEEGGRWPFGPQSRKPFNIFSKRPSYSSERGKLHEVKPEDCEDLRELDVKVSFLNLTRGSMLVPSYNTKQTTIAMVVDGKGCVEIVCPHVGRKGEPKWEEREEEQERGRRREEGGEKQEEREKEQEQEGGRRKEEEGGRQEEGPQLRYKKISAEVSKGMVFVVPPGHPFVGAANNENNIQIVCFGIHARDNERIFLAGKNNVWKRMERAAKELAFGASEEEVDKLLNAQHESVFVSGPGEKSEASGRRGLPLSSILSAFADF